jgi:predicted dehydrogenase
MSETGNSAAVTRRGMLKASAAAATFAAMGNNFAHAAGGDTIKLGLVGCGGRGRGAAGDSLRSSEGVELVTIGDLFQDKADQTFDDFSKRSADKGWKVAKNKVHFGWDAYKAVLAEDIDVVILATPPGFRPMMIEAAIAAGKHVFAEKPVCVDPVGANRIIEAGKVAAQKKLAIVAGTQRRHQPSYIETIKRIHDGAIGKIISGSVYWMQGGTRFTPRQPGWSDTEYQIRNWPYFCWLSGDCITEQHVHQLDVANWVIGSHPKFAVSMGFRALRNEGNIYDFFSTELEYPEGQKVISMSRQIDNCYARVSEVFRGTKGDANAEGKIEPTEGDMWKYDPGEKDVNPYVQEHADLIASIRAGKPLNEATRVAESCLTAIMSRISAYTGKLVRWVDMVPAKNPAAAKPAYADLDLMPKNLALGPMGFAPVPLPGTDNMTAVPAAPAAPAK